MTTKNDNTFAKERDNTFGLSYAREIYVKVLGEKIKEYLIKLEKNAK